MQSRQTTKTASAQQQDATGELLTVLELPKLERLGYVVAFSMLFVISIAVFIGGIYVAIVSDDPTIQYLGRIVALIAPIGSMMSVLQARKTTRRLLCFETHVEFQVIGQSSRIFRYQDIVSMFYHTVRLYVNGAYSGSSVYITLRDKGGNQMSYSGPYKEITKNRFPTIFSKKFEPDEHIDAVRDHLALHVAHQITQSLDTYGEIPLGKYLHISRQGITTHRGKYKGQLVPFDQITDIFFDKQAIHFVRGNDRKSFAGASATDENFWSTLLVIQSLHSK